MAGVYAVVCGEIGACAVDVFDAEAEVVVHFVVGVGVNIPAVPVSSRGGSCPGVGSGCGVVYLCAAVSGSYVCLGAEIEVGAYGPGICFGCFEPSGIVGVGNEVEVAPIEIVDIR